MGVRFRVTVRISAVAIDATKDHCVGWVHCSDVGVARDTGGTFACGLIFGLAEQIDTFKIWWNGIRSISGNS
jgi:hypothetical protein